MPDKFIDLDDSDDEPPSRRPRAQTEDIDEVWQDEDERSYLNMVNDVPAAAVRLEGGVEIIESPAYAAEPEVPPSALPAPEPLKTLQELLAMTFWEVLGLRRGEADLRIIKQAFRKMSLQYHPDKGGDAETFAFISMVAEVLGDSDKRRRYEAGADEAFTGPFRRSAAAGAGGGGDENYDRGVYIVPKCPINLGFLARLCQMQGAYMLNIGNRPIVDYFRAVMAINEETFDYGECKLAGLLHAKLRLIPCHGECPIYNTPRLVRNACLTDARVVELDFPASHGQQMYKYARDNDVQPRRMLEEAFGDAEKITAFRAKPGHGMSAKQVKQITNMLVYGAGSKKMPVTELPADLKNLKLEIGKVREHMWDSSPDSWKDVLKSRKHPTLTMCSVYCQLGERRDLDAVVAKLDADLTLYGYLGDSVLVDAFDYEPFCAAMARDMGIYVTVKKFPQTPEEYFEFVRGEAQVFSQDALSMRQRRRINAFNWASDWLAERVLGRNPGVMPHLEFAIAIEDRLPTAYNPFTRKTEFYCEEEGVWFPDGGQLVNKGEVLSDALDQIFGKHTWVHEQGADGKTKIRLGATPLAMFHTGPMLSAIGEMCRHLRFNTSMVPLDSSPTAHKIVNFRGPLTLDFSAPPPVFDWEDDDELTKALALPIRESRRSDRTMRSTPKEFTEYNHTGFLKLARAMRAAMQDLHENDVLSAEVKAQLAEVIPQHPMMMHCFYEPHLDWDSAIMQARLTFEPCSDTGFRCQVATLKDCGDGSSGKGTLRELCEESLGTYNGDAQLGYSAVLKQETIQAKDKEAPSEQTSNMHLCKHAWVDDFKPTKPLCTAVIRQLSGGNNITSARKHGREFTFKFRGQLMLVTNGYWTPDVPFVGADLRRVTGLSFDVRFVDEPAGPNEMLKNSGIKEHLREYFSEFWFMVRLFWLMEQPRPKSDHTTPQCPNTLGVVAGITEGQFENYEVDKEVVEKFLEEHLAGYALGQEKPSSATEVDDAFATFVQLNGAPGFRSDAARRALRRQLPYKAGYNLPKRGGRAKTTVNVYTNGTGQAFTLRPEPGAPASSS